MDWADGWMDRHVDKCTNMSLRLLKIQMIWSDKLEILNENFKFQLFLELGEINSC